MIEKVELFKKYRKVYYTDGTTVDYPIFDFNPQTEEAMFLFKEYRKFVRENTGTELVFRNLDYLKERKLIELETTYNNANQEDIEYLDTTFQADKYSQNLIVSVLSAGSVPDEFFWLDTTNNQVTMTYEDLQGLSSVILARSQINFVKYQDLKSQVNAATTIDELDSVVW